jgi:hypothetical protein
MFDGRCLIRRAGVSPEGLAQLDLKAADSSWDWNWFMSAPGQTKEVLATALVAIACDKHVWCQIENPAATWSPVIRFLVEG